jgi:hypothetical protein
MNGGGGVFMPICRLYKNIKLAKIYNFCSKAKNAVYKLARQKSELLRIYSPRIYYPPPGVVYKKKSYISPHHKQTNSRELVHWNHILPDICGVNIIPQNKQPTNKQGVEITAF